MPDAWKHELVYLLLSQVRCTRVQRNRLPAPNPLPGLAVSPAQRHPTRNLSERFLPRPGVHSLYFAWYCALHHALPCCCARATPVRAALTLPLRACLWARLHAWLPRSLVTPLRC